MHSNYYEKQLEKVASDKSFAPKIQIIGNNGQTNWMDLNSECVSALIHWLQIFQKTTGN